MLFGTLKQQNIKPEFLSMLFGFLGASLLGRLLAGKGTVRADEDTIGGGQDL